VDLISLYCAARSSIWTAPGASSQLSFAAPVGELAIHRTTADSRTASQTISDQPRDLSREHM
jgi:hypothetical protein